MKQERKQIEIDSVIDKLNRSTELFDYTVVLQLYQTESEITRT